jgi:hypothetical protein
MTRNFDSANHQPLKLVNTTFFATIAVIQIVFKIFLLFFGRFFSVYAKSIIHLHFGEGNKSWPDFRAFFKKLHLLGLSLNEGLFPHTVTRT